MAPTEEASVARLAAMVDSGRISAEMHVRAVSLPSAPPVPSAELAAAGAALERACTALLVAEEPDGRLASRVSLLADALLRAPGPPDAASSIFAGLCAYGTLEPMHDAGRLAERYVAMEDSDELAKTFPAIIALAECPAMIRLACPVAKYATEASGAGDRDGAELAASAVLAIATAHPNCMDKELQENVKEARGATDKAGLVLAERELARALTVRNGR